MTPLLYGELALWYRLLDPTGDHAEETAIYRTAFEHAVSPRVTSLPELGAGSGNNAHYLKRHFQCTLIDISELMLELSRNLNPECEHHLEDMRRVRLDRTFDAVRVHDAVVHMTGEQDLLAAARTAFFHTRPWRRGPSCSGLFPRDVPRASRTS